jgi:hypothetical protein
LDQITLRALNLFLIGAGGDAQTAERAIRALLERLPFFPGRPVETWEAPSGGAVAAWVQHDPDQTGGVRYALAERERLALFAGRPIRWTDEREADGAGAIDPASYLDGAGAGELDGRFVVVRCDDARGELDVVTDPVGAYPVYETQVGAARWVSNNAELLCELRGTRALDPPALAGLLGGGWSLDGHPVWSGVRRVGAGFSAARVAPLIGASFDADRAAAILTAAVAALAAWPGRPSVVPVTAGRDSRLVLAAARHAGIPFETTTGGDDASPDVQAGRRLAELAEVPHSLIPDDPHGSVWSDWRRAAQVLASTEGGTATLADAAGFPLGPREGPLPIWHSGQGGEIARSYYGTGDGDITDRLERAFLGRRPGRTDPLSEDGRALVREQIARWVDEQRAAGIAPADVPDMFYLQRRMCTWAAPTHGAVEFVRDTTSPLWSARLLPDLLGLPAPERARQLFHARVLERLAPELVDVPFERPPSRGRKVLREMRRRVGRGRRAPSADPFAPILSEIREAVLSQPEHPAWSVLDRSRVESLLGTDPAALDTMSRYYAWRLATVFGGFPLKIEDVRRHRGHPLRVMLPLTNPKRSAAPNGPS